MTQEQITSTRVYWVHPNRIVWYLRERFDIFWKFSIMDGDWDLKIEPMANNSVYVGCYEMFVEKKSWHENYLYKKATELITQGIPQWGHQTIEEFDEREAKIKTLHENILRYGVLDQRNVHNDMPLWNPDGNFGDEISVGVGRNGNLLLFNGFHRASISKILKLDKIPIRVIRVHPLWGDFCNKTFELCTNAWGEGVSYHPINHISFDSISHQWSSSRVDLIKKHINKQHKTILDIGSLFGYFCTQLEDAGFQCTAVENYTPFLEVLLKIKEAGYFNFEVFSKSIFDFDKFEYDTILAFNIFHHFLKTQPAYNAFESFLKKLKIKEMFVQLHDVNDGQMKDAHRNYSTTEFLDFICNNTNLHNVCEIGEENNRKIFKISKS